MGHSIRILIEKKRKLNTLLITIEDWMCHILYGHTKMELLVPSPQTIHPTGQSGRGNNNDVPALTMTCQLLLWRASSYYGVPALSMMCQLLLWRATLTMTCQLWLWRTSSDHDELGGDGNDLQVAAHGPSISSLASPILPYYCTLHLKSPIWSMTAVIMYQGAASCRL